ncbi:hypothetical protein BTVI_116741 [Pitangus sulphuratus]|nr:hypothetical protein BTVI_116741 [Pitangus sulphuratus]
MPAGSRMDLLLAKAKPIRSCINTSVITHIRREKNYCAEIIADREDWSENSIEERFPGYLLADLANWNITVWYYVLQIS